MQIDSVFNRTMKINDRGKYIIILLTATQQEIDRNSQFHLKATGTEFSNTFFIKTAKKTQFITGTLTYIHLPNC